MGTDMTRRTATHGAPRQVFSGMTRTLIDSRSMHQFALLDKKRLPGNLISMPKGTSVHGADDD